MIEAPEDTSGFKIWLEDNLRILLSILIVVAIAGGIYSYSKRTQAPTITDNAAQEEVTTEEQPTTQQETTTTSSNEQKNPETTQGTQETTATKPAETKPAAAATPAPESKETEAAFVEVAAKGMGETHLARQALANYLEKSPDSALTKEHKIYIEDYLRKRNTFNDRIHVGTSVEFQKSLIQEAINSAKTLNESQLNHLKIYSARVPSLS